MDDYFYHKTWFFFLKLIIFLPRHSNFHFFKPKITVNYNEIHNNFLSSLKIIGCQITERTGIWSIRLWGCKTIRDLASSDRLFTRRAIHWSGGSYTNRQTGSLQWTLQSVAVIWFPYWTIIFLTSKVTRIRQENDPWCWWTNQL